jgi:hypothetical protein
MKRMLDLFCSPSLRATDSNDAEFLFSGPVWTKQIPIVMTTNRSWEAFVRTLLQAKRIPVDKTVFRR